MEGKKEKAMKINNGIAWMDGRSKTKMHGKNQTLFRAERNRKA